MVCFPVFVTRVFMPGKQLVEVLGSEKEEGVQEVEKV
jgi:hypothetical protein